MTQVIAHRGARSLAPENTLLAAITAYQSGADLWETDINVTRDGHLILFHDETLLRCTNAKKRFPSRASYRVCDFNLKDILSLDAGSYFLDSDPFSQIAHKNVPGDILSACRNLLIPTLDQGLELTAKHEWKINLELKDFSLSGADGFLPDKTLESVEKSSLSKEQVVISSFNHEWLKRVMKKSQIQVQALVGENDTDPLVFGGFEFSTYNINEKLVDDDLIKMLKDKGKTVNLFTVNDIDRFLHYQTLGVDGIFTDFPQLFSAQS